MFNSKLRPILIASSFALSSISVFAAHLGSHSHVGHVVKKTNKTKVYQVIASDQKGMRFDFKPTLEQSPIRKGDTVTFVVKNTGFVEHEFGIDNEKATKELSQKTLQNPMMPHDASHIIKLQPQETKEITWKFEGNEPVFFSCTLPGHFAAGMYKKMEYAK